MKHNTTAWSNAPSFLTASATFALDIIETDGTPNLLPDECYRGIKMPCRAPRLLSIVQDHQVSWSMLIWIRQGRHNIIGPRAHVAKSRRVRRAGHVDVHLVEWMTSILRPNVSPRP